MDPYQETFNTWNKVASLYQDKFMDLDLYDETYDFICRAINWKNARILDIGCGPGNISKYLLSKRPDFNILGIDIAPNMIALARKNNPAASFQVMDSRKIGEIPYIFDGIIAGFCVPYLSPAECSTLISDSYDLLTGQGLFYLSFVEGKAEQSGFQAGSSGDRVYFYYHDLDSFQDQLVNTGFEKPAIFRVPYKRDAENTDVHTILISRKR